MITKTSFQFPILVAAEVNRSQFSGVRIQEPSARAYHSGFWLLTPEFYQRSGDCQRHQLSLIVQKRYPFSGTLEDDISKCKDRFSDSEKVASKR